MSDVDRAVWITRARMSDDPVERVLRVITDGRPPIDSDTAEEIADPFDPAAPAREVGSPLRGGAWSTVGELAYGVPVRPTKILAVGRNFHAHAAELGNEVPLEPLLFFKPPSCLVGSGATVELPRGFQRIDMESELVVVIGRRGRNIARERAYEHVLGYTLGNDVSCRDLQRRDEQWTRAKGFDGFGPVGPFVRLVPPGTAPRLAELRLTGRLDDELRQDASLGLMIFDPAAIIECASAVMTLEAGDIIFMGTPEGVSPLAPGNRVTIELSGDMPLAPLVSWFA